MAATQRGVNGLSGRHPAPEQEDGRTLVGATGRVGMKRYNLVLPETLYQQLEELARDRQVTVVELLRRFIKLGLIAAEVEANPDAALLIREGDTEREIILV